MIGHNPKAHQPTDEMHEISALLRELPRVAAPADFNASLKARLAVVKAEANEFAGVTALVKELPRVAAPADFDFKLRARIAQAKAEQQKVSAGWFAELFGRSFSWVQAGAAMAAVAVVVSLVTMGVLRSNEAPSVQSSGNIAASTTTITPPQTNLPAGDTPATQSGLPPVAEARTIAAVRTRIKYTSSTGSTTASPTGARNNQSSVLPEPAPAALPAAAAKVMIKHRSGEARMVNPSEYNLGLQAAHLRSTPTNTPPVPTAAVNIY